MTRIDIFQIALQAIDNVDCVFDYSETSCWPPGELEALQALGLVRQATSGLHAPCPNCHEAHIEPVTIRHAPDGSHPRRPPRYFIRCPESMRVEVTDEMCIGWQVDGDGLAKAVCDAIGLKSKPKAIVPGRLWRLGRTEWRQSTREVMFATRLCDPDSAAVAVPIGVGGRSIVFVPCRAPDDRIWPGHVPAVVALSRVATLASQSILLDVAAMMEIVADADSMAEAKSAIPVDPEVKKKTVRQQLKAEIKAHLEDDVLIAAFLTHGSGDKAALALSKQLGKKISRDKIYRAVDRAGGIDAVRAGDDSASVARTVASQRRDRAKKFAERR